MPAPSHRSTTPAPRETATRAPGADKPPVLYVATNLDWWFVPTGFALASDIALYGRIFRRLDAMHWAWLARKVLQAGFARDAGRISSVGFDDLLRRWDRVNAWAAEILDDVDCQRARRLLEGGTTYEPPGAAPGEVAEARSVAHVTCNSRQAARTPFPSTPSHDVGSGPFLHPVSADGLAQVESIRDQAIPLGWSDDALFRNRAPLRFPYGETHGLVCFLGPGDRIGEVSRRGIEILSGETAPSGRSSRASKLTFYNRAVEQPWVRRLAA